MQILFHAPNSNPEAWRAAFSKAMPEADFRIWQEGDGAPADYAVVWKPPALMLAPQRGLKAVFNIGAGVDGILELGEDLPHDLPVIRLDDAGMGVQMSEYVTHAVLRYLRRFDQYEVQARNKQWRFLKPYDKAEFTVGILGLGLLGQRIASTLAELEFPLRGWSRTPKDVPGIACFHGNDGLAEFLAGTRVLVCVLPLTSETARILNKQTLGKLPRGAFLVNVARGGHLVEADLLGLVQDGHIAAATLDVMDEEPLPPEHPFWSEPRIALTPHIAALTLRDESARQIAAKIAMLERGEAVPGTVDRLRGY
ncbi:MAG TPA: glyoxylate/hydroxypyruvate reductase A [Burkholderiaceae bacterium]